MAPSCVVCGKISHPGHNPREVAEAFGGIGVDGVRAALETAGSEVVLAHPAGEVVCSLKRNCYRNLRKELLVIRAYKKRHRQSPADEVSALRAVGGREAVSDRGGGAGKAVARGRAAAVSTDDAVVKEVTPLRRPIRLCGTPGCQQRDGHDGACASMMAPPGSKRTPRAAGMVTALGRPTKVVQHKAVKRRIGHIDHDMLPEAPQP